MFAYLFSELNIVFLKPRFCIIIQCITYCLLKHSVCVSFQCIGDSLFKNMVSSFACENTKAICMYICSIYSLLKHISP